MDQKQKKWTILILSLGLFVRLAIPFTLSNNIYKGDGAEYLAYAYNLDKYGVYSGDKTYTPHPGYEKMPGVPLLIWSMSHFVSIDSKLMLLPNVFAGWIILLLLVKFCERLKLQNKLSRIFLLLYACIPVVDYYSAQFYPEVPAACFGFLSFWFLFIYLEKQEWKHALLSGASTAMAVYFRPEMAFNLIVIGAAVLLTRNSIKKKGFAAASVFAAFFFMLSPWIIRNYVNEKKIIPFGDNFLIEHPDSNTDSQSGCTKGLYLWLNTWHYREWHVKTVAWDFLHTDLNILPEDAFENPGEKKMIADLQLKNQYDCGTDRALMEVAKHRIREHPFIHYVSLPLRRIFFLLFRVERFDSLTENKIPAVVINSFWFIFTSFSNIFSLFAIIGLFFLRRIHSIFKWMMIAAWFRLIFFAWIYHVEVRYMMIYFPVFFLVGLVLFVKIKRNS